MSAGAHPIAHPRVAVPLLIILADGLRQPIEVPRTILLFYEQQIPGRLVSVSNRFRGEVHTSGALHDLIRRQL